MGLKREGPPDAMNRRRCNARGLRHRPHAPVRGIARSRLQSSNDHPFNLRIAHLARSAWSRLVQDTVESFFDEPRSPLSHHLRSHGQLLGHRPVGQAFRRQQDNSRAACKRLSCLRSARPSLQRRSLTRRNHQLRFRPSPHHPAFLPCNRNTGSVKLVHGTFGTGH